MNSCRASLDPPTPARPGPCQSVMTGASCQPVAKEPLSRSPIPSTAFSCQALFGNRLPSSDAVSSLSVSSSSLPAFLSSPPSVSPPPLSPPSVSPPPLSPPSVSPPPLSSPPVSPPLSSPPVSPPLSPPSVSPPPLSPPPVSPPLSPPSVSPPPPLSSPSLYSPSVSPPPLSPPSVSPPPLSSSLYSPSVSPPPVSPPVSSPFVSPLSSPSVPPPPVSSPPRLPSSFALSVPPSLSSEGGVPIIEWQHLDKRRFYALGVAMALLVRAAVYPLALIRTRLQVQRGSALYAGTADAFVKIVRREGPGGLYRGFLPNSLTLLAGQGYVTAYELTRQLAGRHTGSNALKSLLAGAAASLVSQTLTVPIDVVSQHLMMQGQGPAAGGAGGRFTVRAPAGPGAPRFGLGQTRDIVGQVLRADGVRGFYRGYLASLLTYIPNSAIWWPFYHFYTERLSRLAPSQVPLLALQAVSGPLAAITAATLTNPMDVVRARLQVEGGRSVLRTLGQLVREEGPRGLVKGLSARLLSVAPSSLAVVLGYETLKRLSLRKDLRESVSETEG
ncbi:solute carrier family 25 member 44-like [Lepisosteus oculatus]|uniref:solute carrier family 25 member 44-like n=1 Tax=Lepisosteus oculatus TaxID=7918 RepID=UPI00371736FE